MNTTKTPIEAIKNREYMTGEQIAERYGIAPRTVRKWAAEGKFPRYKAGRLVRYEVGEVEAYVRGAA